jgi:hypothetical protein
MLSSSIVVAAVLSIAVVSCLRRGSAANGSTAMNTAMAEKVVAQQWQWQRSNGNGGAATAMAVQQRLRQRSDGDGGAATA